MTNAEMIAQALKDLEANARTDVRWFTSRDVMWQARRNGYDMTTARARGICRALARKGQAEVLMDGTRYKFRSTRLAA